MGEVRGEMQEVDCRDRIPAADHCQCGKSCKGPGDFIRSVRKMGKFKDAHGSIPEDGSCLFEKKFPFVYRLRPDVHALPSGRYALGNLLRWFLFYRDYL